MPPGTVLTTVGDPGRLSCRLCSGMFSR